MEKTELLLEYLKEQYAQARQHETRQTNATTFLTAAAAVVLGFVVKDGELRPEVWWLGIIVALIGAANLWINEAHFEGNRLHTAIAGETRRALENAIGDWTEFGPAHAPESDRPTHLRKKALADKGLRGPNVSVGGKVHAALRIVPIGVILIGIAIAVLGLARKSALI